MKNTIDVRRLATDREMKIVRDKLRGSGFYMVFYVYTFIVISFCALCLISLAAFIQYG